MRGASRLIYSVLHSLFAAQLSLPTKTKLLLVFMLTTGMCVQLGYGATINVTTTQWRVSGGPGCSLQEAIYASNYQASVSIIFDATTQSNLSVPTNCTAGTGNDTIVLPQKALFSMNQIVNDSLNPFGPTATPIIFSNITIEANGSQLVWIGGQNARAFAIFTIAPSRLTIRNAHIKGFVAQGGNGGTAGPQAGTGGGGMGAGGAIYAYSNGSGFGAVTVENSTFEGNAALGGSGGGVGPGAGYGGAGGGGMGGDGAGFIFTEGFGPVSGGGGGGSRGKGHVARFVFFIDGSLGDGGGGGGTVLDSGGRQGGYNCGGAGGQAGTDPDSGQDAPCVGGGGGGAGSCVLCDGSDSGGNGGSGAYGGGGGGGGETDGSGGGGGFGGGGGGGGGQNFGSPGGGNGGFGGGGGGAANGKPGKRGTFGGDSNNGFGGGGAGLGGAIFSDGAEITIRNSTFTGNRVFRGEQGGPLSDNGQDAGGAIFMLNGSLTVENSTIAGNAATGSGSGIMVYQQDNTPTSFTLLNTIIYGNSGFNECSIQASLVTSSGFAGNVIQNNDPLNPCLSSGGGVVSVLDPGLGPLLDNGGYTPTIAITKGLTAWGTAVATSLATDQRGHQRPSDDGHGFDIGAFELCTPSNPLTGFPCKIVTNAFTAALTMQVSPANGGTTNPPVGVTNYPLNSIAPIQATPNPGYGFTVWTGSVTDPTNPSTTLIMNQDQIVTANFASVVCVTNLAGVGTSGSSLSSPRIDLTWTQIGSAASYSVMRSTIAGGPYSPIGPSTGSAFGDTNGLTNGGTYYYVLQPEDANGIEICQSNQATVTIPAPRHR